MLETLEKFSQDDLSVYALPVYLSAILIEAFWSYRQKRGLYKLKDTLASLSMLIATAFVEILPRLGALVLMVYLHEISPFKDLIQRQWWAWVLLFS
jgi:hypothetical protein